MNFFDLLPNAGFEKDLPTVSFHPSRAELIAKSQFAVGWRGRRFGEIGPFGINTNMETALYGVDDQLASSGGLAKVPV